MHYLFRKFGATLRALGGCAAALAATMALNTSVMADEANPYLMADRSWIGLSGTVESVQPDSFVLDYGDGTILVEMDDGDRDADAYNLLKGDTVTVSGRIDDDFFETTKIEAAYVYVHNINTTFFASSVDEESYELIDSSTVPPIPISVTVVRGTVTKVNQDEHEFLLDTGRRTLRIDVNALPVDPLDDQGYLRIEEGDRVKVIGQIDTDLFEGRELEADSIVKLYRS